MPVRVTWEVPGKIRIDRQGPGGNAVVMDDKGNGSSSRGRFDDGDLDLLETLLEDRPESFLYSLAEGTPARVLGYGFRTDDGRSPNYRGPFYDPVDLFGQARTRADKPRRHKRFLFDSHTGLLQKVAYLVQKAGGTTQVETELGAWTQVGGERYPAEVRRRENGNVTIQLRISSAAFGARAADGIFDRP